MSEGEIRRRKTADPEMDALMVITQALDGLDVQICERILKWAEERFVSGPKDKALYGWVDNLSKQIEVLQRRAKELGVDDRTLLHAMSHERDRKKLAPVDYDEDVEATEQAVRERLAVKP